MDIARSAAIWQAKRTRKPWAFVNGGRVSPKPFEGFELVALPSGEVVDAFPLQSFGSVDRISSGLLLMEVLA